jgi:hypothetical protein
MGGSPLLRIILAGTFSGFENFGESIFSKFGETCQTTFSKFEENASLEKIIRQFSSILDIGYTKAAN